MGRILKKKITSSSTIASIQFDVKKEELRIKFLSGDTYKYSKVPFKTYMGLSHAGSAGKYLWKHIRNKFSTVKI